MRKNIPSPVSGTAFHDQAVVDTKLSLDDACEPEQVRESSGHAEGISMRKKNVGVALIERSPAVSESRAERDFFDHRGSLVIVAVTNPSGPYHIVGYLRPIQVCSPLRPDSEVSLLVMLQV
jgi:hypothetical protein